jgi:hypothetical protein
VSFSFSTAGGDMEVWRDPHDGFWRVSEGGKSEIFENLEDAILHVINAPRPKKPALRLVSRGSGMSRAKSPDSLRDFAMRAAHDPKERARLLLVVAKVAWVCPGFALALRAVARTSTRQHEMTRQKLQAIGVEAEATKH